MNRIAILGAAVMMLAGAAFGQEAKVFHGEVSDSQCALNIHSLTRSHQEMLKSKSMGGTAATCTTYCIEHLGGEPVLVSGKDGRDVLRLDRPELVHGFEGRKVKITGILDSKSGHIHVLKVEPED